MNKKDCRKNAREIIRSLDSDYFSSAGEMIAETVIASEEYLEAETIFIFVFAKGEPDTLKIIKDALNRSKRVVVPLCINESQMELHQIESLNDLSPGMYGILEPSSKTPSVSLDQIDYSYIPCLSMDKKGNRLGKGRGYYDRLLENADFKGCVLCFDALLFDEIPSDPHDVPVKTIITEKGIQRLI